MTICTQTNWFVAASLAYRLHRRLLNSSRDFMGGDSALVETKRVGDELTQACRTAVCRFVSLL